MQESELIIDSNLSPEEALLQNPRCVAPREIIDCLVLLQLRYWSFDGRVHQGQMVIDKEVAQDVEETFNTLYALRFPIASIVPVAHPKIGWDDDASMNMNNTSAFNYRPITGDGLWRLSYHAYGLAIDINPLLNPYIKGEDVRPKGAVYDMTRSGTIVDGGDVVQVFEGKGWVWGGRFKSLKDYQHFEKHLV